jgi:predicted PurR-regulated permease PerM
MPFVVSSLTSPAPGRVSASWTLLGALAALVVYLSWRLLQPFATVILWAAVLALMFMPLHRRLLARTRKPNLAAAITLVVALVSVLLPLAVVSVAVANEVGTMMDEGPARWKGWLDAPGNRAQLTRFQSDLADRFSFARGFDERSL